MVPKEPFHVHSLSKHIEDAKRGLTAETQYNRRSGANHVSPSAKQEGIAIEASFFGESDSSDENSSEDDSSDGGDEEFMRKLVGTTNRPRAAPATANISSKDEISDSDAARRAATHKAASSQAVKIKSSKDSITSNGSQTKESNNHENIKKEIAVSSGSESDSDSDSKSDSDEESDDEDDGPESGALEQSRSDSTSESSTSESDNESERDEPTKIKPKLTVNGASASISKKSSAKGDDVEKPTAIQPGFSTFQSSSTSPKAAIHEAADESIHMEDRQNGGQQLALPNLASSGFVLRKSNSANGEDVARICSQANLEGKQLWYFTVPSNLPISVVQTMEIPMDREQQGEQVFSHAGEDYGISFDTMVPKSSIQILIPSVDGSQYCSAPGQVDKVMQIKRIKQLGTKDVSAKAAEKSCARAQPKGLKARFQPLGIYSTMEGMGDDSMEDQDVEMPDAASLPTTSVTVTAKSAKKGKRKRQSRPG